MKFATDTDTDTDTDSEEEPTTPDALAADSQAHSGEEHADSDESFVETPCNLWLHFSATHDGRSSRYADATRRVRTIRSSPGFWNFWNNHAKPSQLLQKIHMCQRTGHGFRDIDAVMLFRENVRPVCDDEANKNGGRLQFRFRPKEDGDVIDSYWFNLVMGMFAATFKPSDMVTGVRLVDKLLGPSATGIILIEVWFSNYDDTEAVNRLRQSVLAQMTLKEGNPPFPTPRCETKSHTAASKDVSFDRSVDRYFVDTAEDEEALGKQPKREDLMRSPWVIWEHVGRSTDGNSSSQSSDGKSSESADATRKIISTRSATRFSEIWDGLPQPSEFLEQSRKLREWADGVDIADAIMVSREEIPSDCEDEDYVNGGCFEFRLEPKIGGMEIDKCWNNLVLGMITENIQPANMITAVRMQDGLFAPGAEDVIIIEVWFADHESSKAVSALQRSIEEHMRTRRDGNKCPALPCETKFCEPCVSSIRDATPGEYAETDSEEEPTTPDGATYAETDSEKDDVPLRHAWTFWMHVFQTNDGKSTKQADATLKLVTMSSAKDFWRLWNHLTPPSELLEANRMVQKRGHEMDDVDAIALFRESVRPDVEDEANANGGRLQFRLKPKLGGEQIDQYWNNLVVGTIVSTIQPEDMITGVCLVDRLWGPDPVGDILIEVWFTNFEDTKAVRALRRSVISHLTSRDDGSRGQVPHCETKSHLSDFTE